MVYYKIKIYNLLVIIYSIFENSYTCINMNNIQAFTILQECDGNTREAVSRILQDFQLPESEISTIRSKLVHLKETRRKFVKKNELESWEQMDFCDIPSLPVKASIPKKRKSSDTLNEPMQKLLFEVDPNQEIRTPLLKLQLKQLRHRLKSLLTHIKSIATFEQVSPKTIASLSLKLIANEEKDYGTSEVCRQIVEEGTYGKHTIILSDRKSSFLLDFLSIGKLKYRELRRFLKEDNILITSYDKIAKFRQESCFVNEMQYFHKDFGTPVGIYIPYQFIVEQTIRQIVEDEKFENAIYPLTVMLSDGLDGSGSHKIYNQVQNHPDLSTKSFLLFAFKVLWFKDFWEILCGRIHVQILLSLTDL